MFKRMIRRGRPSHVVYARVSRNLSFLKDNWEDLRDATGGHATPSSSYTPKTGEDLRVVVNFFKKHGILTPRTRRMRDLFREDSKESKTNAKSPMKLEKSHGRIMNRVADPDKG